MSLSIDIYYESYKYYENDECNIRETFTYSFNLSLKTHITMPQKVKYLNKQCSVSFIAYNYLFNLTATKLK